MFCDVTLATYHQNRTMTEVKDICLVRRIQGYDV